jgi:uncharacterized protein with FMN-binding domain
MRRITLWLLSTLAAVVLLFSYRTSLGTTTATPATTTAAVSSTGNANSTASGSTFQGSVAATRWGDVQVSITVADGRITAVNVPVYPNSNGRDQQINARALPILTQETITAQSADIDTVSGATVTSDGYIESLQAALDAAHLS